MQASKHSADDVGGCLADFIAGCSVELHVGVQRGSYSGMLSGTPSQGATEFIGSPVRAGLDPAVSSSE